MFDAFHDAGNIWIDDAVAEFKALPHLIETEKEGMLKIPGDIATTPAVVLNTGVKPVNQEWTEADVPPFDVNIEVVEGCVT